MPKGQDWYIVIHLKDKEILKKHCAKSETKTIADKYRAAAKLLQVTLKITVGESET